MHGFADAGETAWGICIYNRFFTNITKLYQSFLIYSTTRVALTKGKLSIPKKELNAVVLVCEKLLYIANSLEVPLDNLYAHTDSLVSMHWINKDKNNLNLCRYFDALNLELSKVSDWLAVNMLSLNIGKTKYMCFYPRQKNIDRHLPCLTVCGIEIERVKNFNFLGLIINENLSWKSHTDHISTKISMSIGVMNRIKRYSPQCILKTLYFALIHSYLNYSALAW